MKNIVILETIKAEWVELGEGLSGEYNPENPDDVELLRFDIFVLEGEKWVAPQDASYCTRVPVSTPAEQRHKLLKIIAEKAYQATQNPMSLKRTLEGLSWLTANEQEDERILERL